MSVSDRTIDCAGKPGAPELIGIDWGSSSLRVALLDSRGLVIDRRESAAGVFTVPDNQFMQALWPLCTDWITRHRVPLLACGMIGSRQGIVEVPYVACPASIDDLARRLGRVDLTMAGQHAGEPAATLFIVPGLLTGSPETGWDVMRGEETQLLGVDGEAGQVFVMPGTHSKWTVRGAGGRLEAFQTYMTGELFDLLCRHGSISRVLADPQHSPDAFACGVGEARDDALENLLFRVRSAGLMSRFAASALPDYLSGLLIGAEIKAGLQRFDIDPGAQPLLVLGETRLTGRYLTALEAFGCTAKPVSGDVVFAGLLALARCAGLLNPPAALEH